jgi:hypothetical protein
LSDQVEHPEAVDPVARLLYLLLRDHLPFGALDEAIERVRSHQRVVPAGAPGLMACEAAQRIRTLVN